MPSVKKEEETPTVADVVHKYQSVIEHNYQRRELQLMEELAAKTKALKQELAFFKKQASPEHIEQLIAQRRRSKEKARQLLQTQWRQCNEAFKRMQDEQKTLKDQLKENVFDIRNLQHKIEAFRLQIQRLSRAPHEQALQDPHFLTQLSQDPYVSPYKSTPCAPQKVLERTQFEQGLLNRTQPYFFGKRFAGQRQEGRDISSQESQCRVLKIVASHEWAKKAKRREELRQQEQARLFEFLSNQGVRVKLFGLLKHNN